jgi:hypothetical protein
VTPAPERSTLAACIAHVAGGSPSDVPLDGDEQRAWLAERGRGPVPLADGRVIRWHITLTRDEGHSAAGAVRRVASVSP